MQIVKISLVNMFMVYSLFTNVEILETEVCQGSAIYSCGERFNYPAIASNNYLTKNCTGDLTLRAYSPIGQCYNTSSTSAKFGCDKTHRWVYNYANLNCSGI